ncbi:MAG: hypothetical protein ABIM60_05210 [candidate division WOR-3 bacterium]
MDISMKNKMENKVEGNMENKMENNIEVNCSNESDNCSNESANCSNESDNCSNNSVDCSNDDDSYLGLLGDLDVSDVSYIIFGVQIQLELDTFEEEDKIWKRVYPHIYTNKCVFSVPELNGSIKNQVVTVGNFRYLPTSKSKINVPLPKHYTEFSYSFSSNGISENPENEGKSCVDLWEMAVCKDETPIQRRLRKSANTRVIKRYQYPYHGTNIRLDGWIEDMPVPDWVKKSGNRPYKYHYMNGVFCWDEGVWKGGVWEDGIWNNGVWKDGVWKDGVWMKGTWEKGTWEKGFWFNGVWKNGLWKNGYWIKGIWHKGIWENGDWFNGKWKNGLWKKGIFHNGLWEYGVWENGCWYNGCFMNGFFEGGFFLGGFFQNGVFYNSFFEGGKFTNGIFNNSVWKNGFWGNIHYDDCNGLWIDSKWEKGYILDKGKIGNYKEDWEWVDAKGLKNKKDEHNVYVHSPINPNEYFKSK